MIGNLIVKDMDPNEVRLELGIDYCHTCYVNRFLIFLFFLLSGNLFENLKILYCGQCMFLEKGSSISHFSVDLALNKPH